MLWACLCWVSDFKILRWRFWGKDNSSLLSIEKNGGEIDAVL